MQFGSMSVMPVAPLLGGWLLGQVGGPHTIAALVVLSAASALIPTLSRAIRSVPRPAQWRVESEPDTVSPVAHETV
jgi:hypothetical protein